MTGGPCRLILGPEQPQESLSRARFHVCSVQELITLLLWYDLVLAKFPVPHILKRELLP